MTTRKINAAIKHTGLKIAFTRGDGCFYFINSEGFQVGDTVWVCYLNQLSLERWIKEAENAKEQGIY